MARKVILLTDPGIDGAFAIALALYDPNLDVLAVAATAGNIPAEQATRNVHLLVEHFDPPKWPRVGEALPAEYETDATYLHGPGGLGGVQLQCAELHHPHPSDKLIVDLLHLHPGEVSILACGPLTVLARVLDREKNLAALARDLVILGGSWHEPGNATAVAEFHFYCDPTAAQQVLRSGARITLIPLDVMRKALFSLKELTELPGDGSPAGRLLRKIVPYGVGATARHLAIEGFHLSDVLGVGVVAVPEAFTLKPMTVDVETRGELTRGMSVVDLRPNRAASNVEMALDVDMKPVRDYMRRLLRGSDEEE